MQGSLAISEQESIARALQAVQLRIARAEATAGRSVGSVRLLAVSKRHPPDALRAAYQAGQRDFGENYVQELLAKREALQDLPGLNLHLIGNLQSNKAKLVVKALQSIHTVDDVYLVRELARRAGAARQEPLPVLVQVNVGAEPQKHGCAPGELGLLLEAVEREPTLRLQGLMTVPPLGKSSEESRPYFSTLRTLRNLHGGTERLPELSMGMSGDLEVAVEEGATWVRVGTALFGQRVP
jgi:PLP dependent protein